MEPWHWAIVLKPFALLDLFGSVAFFAYLIRPLLPNNFLVALLYDRTYRDRHPVQFTIIVLGVWFSIMASFAIFAARL